MNGIILYNPNTVCKEYSDWLSEKTGFECVETKSEYKAVRNMTSRIGWRIYARGIAGLSF
jgi:hypothetical protein